MKFVTFAHLNQTIGANLHRLPEDMDLVVGVPRSGLMAAVLIALQKNLPVTDLEGLAEDRLKPAGTTRPRASWIESVSKARHVLIVDDSISTGEAMDRARAHVESLGLNARVTYLALFALPSNFFSVDLYFEIINHPRLFEWNYMHHWALAHACVDIDGVLCEDPGRRENDDGPRYLQFLEQAAPRLLPTKPVGTVVTSRLGKYRALTEDWLARHGVEYGELVMLEGVTARERRWGGGHARFKAEVYASTPHALFIESSYAQAVEICQLTERPVFSVEHSKLIEPEGIAPHLRTLARDWRITTRQVARKLLSRLQR
ncbi:phosphoribosyltransferase family protein [Spiribacter pallidus]|uniref:phosphoribosyltransferase family protein n=1 Tax=Spiribacter pallidus TaxID=1987936 RepID=UPI0034A08A86